MACRLFLPLLLLVMTSVLAACSNDSHVIEIQSDEQLVTIPAGEKRIRMTGVFIQGTSVVSAPLVTTRIDKPFAMMRRQVS